MKQIKRTLLAIYFAVIHQGICAQPLLPASEKVKVAYELLITDSQNANLQRNYIEAFPADTRTFLSVFQSDSFDQLDIGSYEYLMALRWCAGKLPEEVLTKCIAIGKNLVWNADAVNFLQHISIELGGLYPLAFVAKYNELTRKEQTSLINFYADVEAIDDYPEYQQLIGKLNDIGHPDIAAQLDEARKKRMLHHHH
jgi:hypothetical protein